MVGVLFHLMAMLIRILRMDKVRVDVDGAPRNRTGDIYIVIF